MNGHPALSSPLVPSDPTAPPRHAILLVAGRGTRLAEANPDKLPKPLVDVGGRSIFERQVRALARVGVQEILLVVGHAADVIAAAAARLAPVTGIRFTLLPNPDFADTNTIYSQYLARGWLDRPVWCLNGDVLFPADLLRKLLDTPGEAALAVDVKRCGEEEVKVVLDERGRVLEIGKQLDPVRCLGEFVGVARYSARAAAAFARALELTVEVEGRRRDYFELALGRVHDVPLHTLCLHGEPILEIDSSADLTHARVEVAPRIDARAAMDGQRAASSVQEAIFRDHVRQPGTHMVSVAMRLRGTIDTPALERAFVAMMRSEPLLHSTWARRGERLVRHVDPDCIPGMVVVAGRGAADLHARMAEEAIRPIDVAREASGRALLLHEGPGAAILQLSFHHLAYDAVSVLRYLDVFFDQLDAPCLVVAPEDRFERFVAWEERWQRSAEASRVAMSLAEAVPGPLRLRVPVAPALRTQLQVGALLPTEVMDRRARDAGTAPVILLLAAWAEALHHWLDDPELILGTTMSLRGQPTFTDLPGPVFNYVPLRLRREVDGVSAARQALATASAGRTVPLSRLPGHDPAAVALGLNANFNYYDVQRAMKGSRAGRVTAGVAVSAGGLRITQLPIAELPVVRPYDLNLGVVRSAGGYRVGLRYRADMLDQAEARALLDAAVRGAVGELSTPG